MLPSVYASVKAYLRRLAELWSSVHRELRWAASVVPSVFANLRRLFAMGILNLSPETSKAASKVEVMSSARRLTTPQPCDALSQQVSRRGAVL